MGSLSNLYISQSYQSLTHFGNNSSASTTLTELEDGVGNGLGISLNTLGDLDVERQLIVHYGAEITGAVDINTTFSGSTQGFVNQSSVNNLIRITGSYTASGNEAAITEIGIGWVVNGGALTNGRVIAISGSANSDVTYTIDQFYTANGVTYTFTGSIERAVDITGDLDVSDDLFVGGHLIIEDGVEITGSIDITGDVTASNAWIQGDLVVSGTINAYEIITTIESASVIFSSGSNILGDEITDTQTLIGSVIISGSQSLTGSIGITGNLNVGGAGTFGGTGSFIGNLTATGNISSSTISGIGNVTQYSQSVSQSILILSQSVSSSQFIQDRRLNNIEISTASLNAFTASQQPSFNALNSFTASQLIINSGVNSFTASAQNSINQLNIFTSSLSTTNLATTGSNIFVGNQTISGSLTISSSAAIDFNVIGNSIYSGSVRGNVNSIAIVAQTASIDCSISNFFTLTLISESNTRLEATNINPGQTISLKIEQSQPTIGTVSYPSNIKFPSGLNYSASLITSSIDILTFVSYDSTNLFGVVVENFK